MKYLFASLMLMILLMGCTAFRGKGETYSGYSCRESIMHYYAYCSDQKLTKDEFEAHVTTCEENMKSQICDKELADLLWCQGRVVPGVYTKGRGVAFGASGIGIAKGHSTTIDGCDCSTFAGAMKECRMKNGIFEEH